MPSTPVDRVRILPTDAEHVHGRRRLALALALALAFALGAAACARARVPDAAAAPGAEPGAEPGAAAEVVATVERMFAGMRARDTTLLRTLLAPDLVIVSARAVDTGAVVRRQGTADFLRSVVTSRDELRERMWSPDVRVDGAIATVWAPYDFHLGDRFSHCGHDAFQLARVGGRWVVTGLTYTVRPAPCPAAPGGAR
jgi:hypothetical protein